MKKFVLSFALVAILLAPAVSLAQTPSSTSCYGTFTTGNKTLGKLFEYATCVISVSIIPLIFALATMLFIWGVVMYVINSDDEAKKDQGRQYMIWGLIGLTVMLCVWGLVEIIGNTFGVNTGFIPKVKT